ncbi:MAG: hypothetical protein WB697_10340 [Stellaceae bacterium]
MAYEAIDNLPAVHPGEFLADELEALHMSARKFAQHIDVPPMQSRRSLTGNAESALKWRFASAACSVQVSGIG